MKIRRANERGHAEHGWLDSFHTFSFADYYDPKQMGFRSLRVINEDRVAPGGGFPRHGHRDMEIVTYVLDGALEHKDSMGNGSVMKRGDVQRMSAGTGVAHSEFNASDKEPVHFLQIWIQPDKAGHTPSYEQKAFTDAERSNTLRLIASSDGHDGSVRIHQNASIYATLLEPEKTVTHDLGAGRGAWVHVVRGKVAITQEGAGPQPHPIAGVDLETGDAAAITDSGTLKLSAKASSEVLVFDLG